MDIAGRFAKRPLSSIGAGPLPRCGRGFRARHARFGRALALSLALGLCAPAVAGCGWAPLYADPQTAPADADLRAIRVAPIPERIGQKLELALRRSLNPSGEPTPQRYVLSTTLALTQANLGITTQGLGTLGRTDAYAVFRLNDSKSGAQLLAGTSHASDAFDLLANGYSNLVAMEASQTRIVEELRRDLIVRLTLFMQRREAAPPPPPTKPPPPAKT